jgi:APA family basic amino acid/polyamine antiporter
MTVVVAFIVIGIRFVGTASWHPWCRQVTRRRSVRPRTCTQFCGPGDVFMGTQHSVRRWRGITGAARVFFAYLGFEAVSTAGAEARNPARDMPIGIIGALVICTALYIATSAVLVGIVPYAQLDTPAPIALAVNRMGMPWFAFLVKIGAIAGLSSVMLVLLYGQTRIFYTMSRDGLLPSIMSVVHKR